MFFGSRIFLHVFTGFHLLFLVNASTFRTRILFSNILALVDLDFAKRMMGDLNVNGVVVMSEKHKFDTESVLILCDDAMGPGEHLQLSTTQLKLLGFGYKLSSNCLILVCLH